MRPPYDPAHVEAITFGASNTTVSARCGRHYTGPARRLGAQGVAQELADDFNSHRSTYVQAVPA